jgi:hypothetical protein
VGFEPDFLVDGDSATALSVNATFNDAQAWVDAINVGGTRRAAFNHRHAGRLIRQPGAVPLHFETDNDGTHFYNRTLFTTSAQYTTWNGGPATNDTANNPTGDRIVIGHPDAGGAYTGPLCEIVWSPGFRLGIENGDQVGALMILFNVNVRSIGPGNGTAVEVMICLQFQLNGGATWVTVETSERFVTHDDHHLGEGELHIFDVPITALVLPEDITESGGDPATALVTGVRACVSLVGSGTTTVTFLEHWNLSYLPLFGEVEVV